MDSAITTENAQSLTWTPRTEARTDNTYPRRIFTRETDQAPAGYITDDTARGSLFWEAVTALDAGVGEPNTSSDEELAESQTYGKPFRVVWQSTRPLPFHRCRGLRNAWNQNRDVKIARDGTELETLVGATMIQMFHDQVPPQGLRGPQLGAYGGHGLVY